METKIVNKINKKQKEEVFEIMNKSFCKKIKYIWLFTKNTKEAREFIINDAKFENGIYLLINEEVAGYIAIDRNKNLFFDYKFKNFINAFGTKRGIKIYLYNKFISFFESNIKKEEAHIQMIAVSEEFQGMGIGSKLIEETINTLKKENINKLLLDVVDTNENAKKLYEKLGFSIVKVESIGKFAEKAGFTKAFKMEMLI